MKKNKNMMGFKLEDWFGKFSKKNKRLRVWEKGGRYIKRKNREKLEEKISSKMINAVHKPLVKGLVDNLKIKKTEETYNAVDVYMFIHYMFSYFSKMMRKDISYNQIKDKKILLEVSYLYLKFYKQKPFFDDLKLLLSYVSVNLLGKEANLDVYFLDNDHNISRYIASNLGRVLVKGVKFRDFINPVQKDLDMRMDINLVRAARFEDLDKVNMHDTYIFLKLYIYKYFLCIYKDELDNMRNIYLKNFLFSNKVKNNNWVDISFIAKLNWIKLLYYFFFNGLMMNRTYISVFIENTKNLSLKLNVNLFYKKESKGYAGNKKYAYFLNKLKHLDYWTHGSLLKGYKMHFKGRFSRKLRKSSVWFTNGSVGTSYMTARIDYGSYSFILKNSICNLKVWLHKTDMQSHYNFKF